MIKIKTKLPGPKSKEIIRVIKKRNIGYYNSYPYVHSGKGKGCYFEDLDKNRFLDFASQVCSNPLGYNHPKLKKVVKKYSKTSPIRYAGQDFNIKEHAELLNELVSITPKNLNMGFLINSGAEAVENCIKLALRKQKKAKFGIAFHDSFHGRTLGALSCTDSKPIQKENFLFIPIKHIDFNENAIIQLEKIMKGKKGSDVGFLIIECVQGEGGYNFAPVKLMKDVSKFCNRYKIPLIIDEVQAGMGRTGKWWAFEHYGVEPDLMSSAKALQVGACVASDRFKVKPGTISSTWGGGDLLNMAVSLETIKIIKEKKLLLHIDRMGKYILKKLNSLDLKNVRGKGLMIAFDFSNSKKRDKFVKKCLDRGLVLLDCGKKSVRVVPPYIISEKEIDEGVEVMKEVLEL